ncbi:MAG: type III pantothenate kinase [Oscillospiraceae bacterium]|nr:type III pantothenate kinase [Oscillospiraceae bacterium]MCD7852753.1 type III pantothenate kinase [Oscillospiraceae bacterium]MCD8255753.1 type III pantothenate kinase [Oscillospiraceae bacterium]MCD8358648.1 type III pantothenate kinase [Oscillospiraceae bacterium]
MILTIDIGNSSTVVCCVENGARRARFVLASDAGRTADEYAALLGLLADRESIALSGISGAIIASVVPQLTPALCGAVERTTGCQSLIVGPGVKNGLNIRMEDPAELGGDLVAAAVAALERYRLPCILVDMGTATAIGVIDDQGSYIGGLICPGVALGRSSLSNGASQLADVSLEAPKHVIGRNTRDSIQSGLLYGAAAMLDGIITRVESELGQPGTVVVTGDGARDIVPRCYHNNIFIDDDLIMRGLWSIYRKNRDAV